MNALIQHTHIDSRPSANSLNMYPLRRFSTLLKDDRIADLRKRLKDERRGNTNHHVSQRVNVRQNVSKRDKARQTCVDTSQKNLPY